jgi:dTMP kinase
VRWVLASRRGVFISLEGPDGSGKSTQAKLLAAELRRLGHRVLATREPGGSSQSAKIRALVLGAKGFLSPSCELLLFLADRAQHVTDTIEPALKQGKVVICDRFGDSTLAYQGGGRGFSLAQLGLLNRFATGGLKPQLTLLFDLGAQRRRRLRLARGNKPDRMEREGEAFQKRVRAAFLRLAKRDPRRIKLIAIGGKTPAQVRDLGMAQLKRLL